MNKKDITANTFAQALAAHLESRGLTQKHIALMLDVTEGMVSQYIAGHRKPGEELMEKIVNVLESRLEYTESKGWVLIY